VHRSSGSAMAATSYGCFGLSPTPQGEGARVSQYGIDASRGQFTYDTAQFTCQ
jgi:hypothetical protein